jgi:hypothetical protein
MAHRRHSELDRAIALGRGPRLIVLGTAMTGIGYVFSSLVDAKWCLRYY